MVFVKNKTPRKPMQKFSNAEISQKGFLKPYISKANSVILSTMLEGWPSGLRRTPGKRVGGQPPRGFESLSLRGASKFLVPFAFLVKDTMSFWT